MASVKKFTKVGAGKVLAHVLREEKNPGNPDIDHHRTQLNYALPPARAAPNEYLRQRLAELSVFRRTDVKVLCGWVVTLPADAPEKMERPFFEAVASFLSARYGEENTVASVVHKDESQPHLHFLFIPAVSGRVCACEVITRNELRVFHRDLQQELDRRGIMLNVKSGITGGHNRTVRQLKNDKEIQREIFAGEFGTFGGGF